jgi:hypothetical protein
MKISKRSELYLFIIQILRVNCQRKENGVKFIKYKK